MRVASASPTRLRQAIRAVLSPVSDNIVVTLGTGLSSSPDYCLCQDFAVNLFSVGYSNTFLFSNILPFFVY